MKKNKKKTNNAVKYIETKDRYGSDVLCPLTDEQEGNGTSAVLMDDCFEKDVAERYSGNIDIAGKEV